MYPTGYTVKAPTEAKPCTAEREDAPEDGSSLLRAELEAELEEESRVDMSYFDNQTPNKWVNPYLDLFQDQFVCQYAYSLIARDPKCDEADHQCFWRNEAEKCARAILMESPSSKDNQKPRPSGIICGMSRIPSMLDPESSTWRKCARCGRRGLVRMGLTVAKMSNSTFEDWPTEETEQGFCRICTNTGMLSEHAACPLYAISGKYVPMTNTAAVAKGNWVADKYLSFDNHPSPGRTMNFGKLKLTLDYGTPESETTPSEETEETSSLTTHGGSKSSGKLLRLGYVRATEAKKDSSNERRCNNEHTTDHRNAAN